MMIQLTDKKLGKFYVKASLVIAIYPYGPSMSEIRLSTGNVVICKESPDKVAQIINDVIGPRESVLDTTK